MTLANPLRALRSELGLSQANMATRLGVSLESYRPWETGRRHVPGEILERAWRIVGRENEGDLLPLSTLAVELKVHVRTLRQAASDGRLAVTFDHRTCFGRSIVLTTRAAGRAFIEVYYRKTTRWTVRPPRPAPLPSVPPNYYSQLVGIRSRLGLTQSQLATAIGAAGKAVVYQWESRKRKPSPVFWQRIQSLESKPPS